MLGHHCSTLYWSLYCTELHFIVLYSIVLYSSSTKLIQFPIICGGIGHSHGVGVGAPWSLTMVRSVCNKSQSSDNRAGSTDQTSQCGAGKGNLKLVACLRVRLYGGGSPQGGS